MTRWILFGALGGLIGSCMLFVVALVLSGIVMGIIRLVDWIRWSLYRVPR